MKNVITKNLYSEAELTEENQKEFLEIKSTAQKRAEDKKEKFEATYKALFDEGLFVDEHFTIQGTQQIFDEEKELEMFQDDENGLYTRYMFNTKLPTFDTSIQFIQYRIEKSEYDENDVPLKPFIDKADLHTYIKNDYVRIKNEMVYDTKIDCYRYGKRGYVKVKTFADKYFKDANSIKERLNDSIYNWKVGLAKYSKAYKYAKDERFIEFKKSIDKILKRTEYKLFVGYKNNEHDNIEFSVRTDEYGYTLLEFNISTDNSLATRLISLRRHTDKVFAKMIIDVVHKYTQEDIETQVAQVI